MILAVFQMLSGSTHCEARACDPSAEYFVAQLAARVVVVAGASYLIRATTSLPTRRAIASLVLVSISALLLAALLATPGPRALASGSVLGPLVLCLVLAAASGTTAGRVVAAVGATTALAYFCSKWWEFGGLVYADRNVPCDFGIGEDAVALVIAYALVLRAARPAAAFQTPLQPSRPVQN